MNAFATPSLLLAAALLTVAAALSACRPDASSDSARLAGYAVGYSTAHRLGGVGRLPPDAFEVGLRDGLAGGGVGTATMGRAELLERMRLVFRQVAEADINARAEMVD